MKGTRLAAVITAALGIYGLQARADGEDASPAAREATADARCVIVGMSMGNIHDASVQTAALMAMYYYLGRLDARSPKPDLEALLAEESVKMTPADVKTEAVRCGSELTQRGKQIQIIGQHLIERGKQLQLEKLQQKQ